MTDAADPPSGPTQSGGGASWSRAGAAVLERPDEFDLFRIALEEVERRRLRLNDEVVNELERFCRGGSELLRTHIQQEELDPSDSETGRVVGIAHQNVLLFTSELAQQAERANAETTTIEYFQLALSICPLWPI